MNSADETVLRILEHGSITGAARATGLTQPALSNSLIRLEQELGFKIFNRKTNPVSLTVKGRLYVDLIRRRQKLTDRFEEKIKAVDKGEMISLSIGATVSYADSIVMEAVAKLSETHPDCLLTIRAATMDNLVKLSGDGKLDCFISTHSGLPEQFRQELLFHDRYMLVVPSGSPLVQKLSDSRERGSMIPDYSLLNGSPFILLDEEQPLRQKVNAFFGYYGIQPSKVINIDHNSVAVRLAKRKCGICFLPQSFIRFSGLCVGFDYYPLPDMLFKREVLFTVNDDLECSPLCGELKRTLLELAGEWEKIKNDN
ncbi:MAG: LysR family transcriptional regulator [Clostridia bacterium]|nr:LysR family transcriptional regulator [Clostridia bacterium]